MEPTTADLPKRPAAPKRPPLPLPPGLLGACGPRAPDIAVPPKLVVEEELGGSGAAANGDDAVGKAPVGRNGLLAEAPYPCPPRAAGGAEAPKPVLPFVDAEQREICGALPSKDPDSARDAALPKPPNSPPPPVPADLANPPNSDPPTELVVLLACLIGIWIC